MTRDERELRSVLLDYTDPPSGLARRVFAGYRGRLEGSRTGPHSLIGATAITLAVLVVGTLTLIAASRHAGSPTSPAASGARLRSAAAPTPSVPVAGACLAADTSVRLMGVAQAMNQPRAEFEVTSTASAPCHMNGWPNVQMLDGAGALLTTNMIRATSVYILGTEERPENVVIQPGGHAYFGVGWANSVAPSPCERPARFRIALPGAAGSVDVRIVLGDGSSPEVCAGGALSVLPVQPAPPAVNFNIANSPTPSRGGPVTGDQAGSFCLVSGSASVRVDFSGGSPPNMRVVARALPANSEVEILWGSPYAGGAAFVGRFTTDANGNANANPPTAPLQPGPVQSVYVDYYPSGKNSSNAKPTPYGQAAPC